MFMYDQVTKCLNVYNIDMEQSEDVIHVFKVEELNQERLVTNIPQFNYSPRVKYFIDQEKL